MAVPNNQPALPGLAQSCVFYTDTWTQEVDKRFIELLRGEKERGQFDPSRRNTVAIRRVMRALNAELHTEFGFDFCTDRVKKLHRRYKTFYYITKYAGVTFDLETQKIDCDAALWAEICKSRRLAMAYATQGEAEYDNLRFIFKQEDDSVGWHKLEEIEQISSEFSDLSFPEGFTIPPDVYDVSSGSSFWRYVVGDGFGNSPLFPSGSVSSPTISASNFAVFGSEVTSAPNEDGTASKDEGGSSKVVDGAGTSEVSKN